MPKPRKPESLPSDVNQTVDIPSWNSSPTETEASRLSEAETKVEVALSVPSISDFEDRYQCQEVIGTGGMAEIYSCSDKKMPREVVAKVLHEKLLAHSDAMERFQLEIRIMSQLEHPGILPVYDAGTFRNGRPCFIMRRVWGVTLKQRLRERASTSDFRYELLRIFEKICNTLAYAHTMRVIHRDLNPLNIMIGLHGQVNVMDWGLAKELSEEFHEPLELPPQVDVQSESPTPDSANHTQYGRIMGTLAYMPPEQANGNITCLDERGDVFALGAILCEILTGLPPYLATKPLKLWNQAKAAELADAFRRLDICQADPFLITLAKSCLAATREQRPRDAGAVLTQLNRYFELVLRQAEWDLVRFFDLSMELFCIAGLDGRFRRINNNFSRVLGHTTETLLASPFISFVHPDDHVKTYEVMAQLTEGDPVVNFRNRYRDSEGTYRWFEWTAKSIPEEKLIFAVAREVTDEVIREARYQQLEEMLRKVDTFDFLWL